MPPSCSDFSLEPWEERLDALKHCFDTRQHPSVSRTEWPHHFAIVWFDEPCKRWDSTRHTCLGDKREESNHCQAAILHLANSSHGLLLFCLISKVSKWIIERQRSKWTKERQRSGIKFEIWVLPWLSSTHMMCHSVRFECSFPFTPKFKEADDKYDLDSGSYWSCIPYCWRRKTFKRGIIRQTSGQWEWPTNAVFVQTIANETC